MVSAEPASSDADRSAVGIHDESQATVAAPLLQEEVPPALVGADEAGHEGVRGVGEDLGRCARLGDHPTLGEDHHLVRQGERLVDVMGDEHDRLAELALQAVQLDLEVGSHDRVHRPERLVHQQDVGVAGQGPGDAHALLLTTRELAGIALGQRPVQPHLVEQLQR